MAKGRYIRAGRALNNIDKFNNLGAGSTVSNLSLGQDATKLTANFTYNGSNSIPPEAGTPVMTFATPNTPTAGELVTFSMPNYFSPSGLSAGTHIYKLYVGNELTGSFTEIYDSSANGGVASYTLTTDDAGKLLLQAYAVDSKGTQSLEPGYSEISAEVVGAYSIANIFDHQYNYNSDMEQSDNSAAGVGDPVDEIKDQLSTAHLLWEGAGTRPNREASTSMVEIDANNECYGSTVSSNTTNEVWWVITNNGDGENPVFGYLWRGGNWTVQLITNTSSSNDGTLVFAVSGGSYTAQDAVPSGTKAIVRFVENGASSKVYVNGVEVIGTMTSNNGFSKIVIGDTVGGQSQRFTIDEILVKRALTDSGEADFTLNDLADRHSITLP